MLSFLRYFTCSLCYSEFTKTIYRCQFHETAREPHFKKDDHPWQADADWRRDGFPLDRWGERGWSVPRKHSPALSCEPETSFLSLSTILRRKKKSFHVFPATVLIGNSGKFWLQGSSGLGSFVSFFLLVHCDNNLNALGSGSCWRGGLFGTVKMWKSCVVSRHGFRHHSWQHAEMNFKWLFEKDNLIAEHHRNATPSPAFLASSQRELTSNFVSASLSAGSTRYFCHFSCTSRICRVARQTALLPIHKWSMVEKGSVQNHWHSEKPNANHLIGFELLWHVEKLGCFWLCTYCAIISLLALLAFLSHITVWGATSRAVSRYPGQ